MDGKTSWRDKVLVGRLWKTVKDEEVSLKACVMVAEARAWPPASVCFSTRRQPRRAVDGKKSAAACFVALASAIQYAA
ncbi:hypothetical protein [Accumulibacter sp.]|uniref:hypothetical protein n=1 Tax=Accumulibacter sp. TaxID=2053492 RepID=UPI0038FCFA3E